MNGYASVGSYDNKPLPTPGADAPPPPPKSDHEQRTGMAHDGRHHLEPINTSTLGAGDGPRSGALTPVSPAVFDPSSPSASADRKGQKKPNPLTDLIETEKVYVDLLTGIIRKVAAAWSRSNLPPPELDSMFRSVETVYKANRSLLAKLKEIGANPSSPKALGDLLMRWIDDLEPPYTKYCTNYSAGFDDWDPVQSNPRLRTTLAMFSATNPPPLPPASPEHPAEPPLWTLDDLFLLPKERLRYYRKLYSRLLKSTTPGRSDHRLLTGALEKLDGLMATLDERAHNRVGSVAQGPQDAEDEVVIDLRTRDSTMPLAPPSHRGSDSTHASSNMSSNAFSQDTSATSIERSNSTSTLSMPITDLERRLSTERTLDIFTMQPKQVRLQIAPPTLHYARELRISADVTIQVVPRATGVEARQERGHIYILTDLLLMCERMAPQDAARYGSDGPDMWLLYPPLAGKHLRVAPLEGSDTALTVTILRKEIVTMTASSRHMRDKIIAEFEECIDSAALLMTGKNQQPPPPVPKLPSNDGVSPTSPTGYRGPDSNYNPSNPSNRAASPSASGQPYQSLNESMANMGMSDPRQGPPQNMAPHGMPPNGNPGSMYPPPRSTSAAPQGQSFNPGQIMPNGPPGDGRVMSPTSYGPGPGQGMSGPGGYNRGPMGGPQHLNLQPQQYGPGQGFPPRGASMNSPITPISPNPPMRSSSYSDGPSPPPQGQGNMGRMASPYPPSRPPSDGSGGPGLRKSTSSRSLASQYDQRSNGPLPPMPAYPDGLAPPSRPFLPRTDSSSSLSSLPSSLYAPQAKPLLPSAQISLRSMSSAPSFVDPSPPSSPVQETPKPTGPTTTAVTAQMKCKVFLQEQHAKWKSLGSAKLKLYHESPTNVKQLVVEADNNKKTMLISTIVLEDGVERVGKTGVAIELSDKGQRTGIVYMIQLRDEKSAGGLYEALLAGSDRADAGR